MFDASFQAYQIHGDTCASVNGLDFPTSDQIVPDVFFAVCCPLSRFWNAPTYKTLIVGHVSTLRLTGFVLNESTLRYLQAVMFF